MAAFDGTNGGRKAIVVDDQFLLTIIRVIENDPRNIAWRVRRSVIEDIRGVSRTEGYYADCNYVDDQGDLHESEEWYGETPSDALSEAYKHVS